MCVEFETFLASLPSVRSIYSATSEDVSRFLVWRDRHGKRIVRVGRLSECFKQTRMPLIAVVPSDLRLKLSIPILGNFIEAGRTGDWNALLGLGNPAASSSVQSYLNTVLRSNCVHILSLSRRSPRFFYRSFCSWRGYGIERCADPSVSPLGLFILARDQAFFKTILQRR